MASTYHLGELGGQVAHLSLSDLADQDDGYREWASRNGYYTDPGPNRYVADQVTLTGARYSGGDNPSTWEDRMSRPLYRDLPPPPPAPAPAPTPTPAPTPAPAVDEPSLTANSSKYEEAAARAREYIANGPKRTATPPPPEPVNRPQPVTAPPPPEPVNRPQPVTASSRRQPWSSRESRMSAFYRDAPARIQQQADALDDYNRGSIAAYGDIAADNRHKSGLYLREFVKGLPLAPNLLSFDQQLEQAQKANNTISYG